MVPIAYTLLFCVALVVGVPLALDDRGDLIFVQIIYRHGARTPTHTYPTDPYQNLTSWPYNWGQLTDVGKQQQYELGKYVRDRYDGYLSKNYTEDEIYVRSTDKDRTLMSAYCHLAGLYEPQSDSNWNKNILWTPIPVHTIPEELDEIVAGKKSCPKYDSLEKDLDNSEELQAINKQNEQLYKYLAEKSGETIKDIHDMKSLYGVLVVEDQFGYELPDWTKQVYPQPMKNLSEFTFRMPCYNESLARLQSGPFVKDIITRFQQKIANEIIQKFWMFSAHDTTIANLLQTLDMFDGFIPPYCSTVFIELRKKSNDYFILFQYRNSTSLVEPFDLQLPGCDVLCPLDRFIEITKPIVPEDWDDECQLI